MTKGPEEVALSGTVREARRGKHRARSGNFDDVGGLGAFLALDNFEVDGIALLKTAIAITDDGGIVDEDVSAVVPPDEAVPFGVVEPFDASLHDVKTSGWNVRTPGWERVAGGGSVPKRERLSRCSESRG